MRVRAMLRSCTALTVLAVTVEVAPAWAAAIPGASYSGIAADGAKVQLTVSADGSQVDSWKVTGVTAPGGCQFTGEEDANGLWPGAPISAENSFRYDFYDAIDFRGTFSGTQSVSGSFHFYNHATANTKACDTGVVVWTAQTSATAPSGGGSGAGAGSGSTGGGGSAGSNGNGANKPRFATKLVFRKLSTTRLGGAVSSHDKSCVAGRTVTLWRGKHKLATAKTKAGGKFGFARSGATRGRYVWAAVSARTLPNGTCMAVSSRSVRV